MFTECCECDRHASRFWGQLAYCKLHIAEGMRESPKAHDCVSCGTQQPAQVLWMRKSPCQTCQNKT